MGVDGTFSVHFVKTLLFMTKDHIRLSCPPVQGKISGSERILVIYKASIALLLIAVQQTLESLAIPLFSYLSSIAIMHILQYSTFGYILKMV